MTRAGDRNRESRMGNGRQMGGIPNTGSLLGGRRNAWMFFSSLVFSGGDGSGEMGVARDIKYGRSFRGG